MSQPHGTDKMENDGISDGDGEQQTKKKPTFMSNNFENYLNMKNQSSDKKKEDRSTQDDGQWNHFTTPLDPTREPPSSLIDKDSERSKYSIMTPSFFSDLERSQTVDRFANIIMERIGGVMSSGKLSKAWQSSGGGGSSTFSWLLTDYSSEANSTNQDQSKKINPDDYAAERTMIKPHLTPMLWGSSCVVLSLFSMRVGRWYQGRYVGRTLSRNKSQTSHMNSSSKPTSNNMKSIQDIRRSVPHESYSSHSTSNQSPFRKELTNSLMSSLNTLPVDLALSMLFGISTTVFLTRPHYLMKDLASTPLLEGKSVLAEELCVPFREEMKNVNGQVHIYTSPYNNGNTDTSVERRHAMPYSDLWKDENLGEFDSLRAIRDFVSNCHEREKVAKKMIDDDAGDASEQELMEMKISPDLFSGDIDGVGIVE